MDITAPPGHLDALTAMVWTWTVSLLPRLGMAILILVAGVYAARWVSAFAIGAISRTGGLDATTRPLLTEVARYTVFILFLLAALSQIGVQTASLLAVLGAAGLAVGLALQGTLANIAAGIMLLWLRPFRVGDYVEMISNSAIAGTIEEIELFGCRLRTHDGVCICAPNSTIWNSALRNYSQDAGRLVSYRVRVPNDADSEEAKAVLLRMAQDDPRLLNDPAPDVFLDQMNNEGLLLTFRAWVHREHIGEYQRTALEQIRTLLTGAGDKLRPLEIARAVPADADPSRMLVGSQRG